MNIISLHQVSLHIAGNTILRQVDWHIQRQDRIALVGRNGAGKSSLMSLLQGELSPDSGKLQRVNQLRVGGLTQMVPAGENESVYHFLVQGLGETGELLARFHHLRRAEQVEDLAYCQQQLDQAQAWELLPRVELMASRLGLDIEARMGDLSGGMIRRVLLAAALIAEPDLLLLDEPTNHLDIASIEWLEAYLKTWRGSLVVVTHDRAFLQQVANKIVEIDRGRLLTFDCTYDHYLDRREALRLAEAKEQALFDKRLADEEVWIRQGVKARRTRNEGRVRALEAMRAAYHKRRKEQGKIQAGNIGGGQSGQIVLETKNLSYAFPASATPEPKSTTPLSDAAASTQAVPYFIEDLSLLLMRGDKLGIIGPNGCGKTTLVRLLLGELQATSGTVRQGTHLQVAYFDQLRAQLDENATVMANVAQGSDFIEVEGKKKHVTSWLQDFLFPPEKFNQKVSTLSGGERNRLLLARLFAKPVNLLVLDEPTNDLDMETLELLENILVNYQGTLLLISHDRAFINQVVTSVLVYEGAGKFQEYVGGFDDYLRVKKQKKSEPSSRKPAQSTPGKKRQIPKLTYKEKRELAQLPSKIETIEHAIAALHVSMAKSEYYQQDAGLIAADQKQLASLEQELAAAFARWESLEERE
ncbi:MAG: ATP-binding cassette domain-containing protein [Legionellaceae bacterium]|nr:ATP-binding cassette domain-containing protein [Legionellaceae bacterium]